MSFAFEGSLSSSKSLFNRALIVQSFFPKLEIKGASHSEDVFYLQNSLKKWKNGETEFYVGEGGTTFRFLLLRLSRSQGCFRLKGKTRLFERPQEELKIILQNFGIATIWTTDSVGFETAGWQKPLHHIEIDNSVSSQFASSLLLNSWDLAFDLDFSLKGSGPSDSYFFMTLALCRSMGMVVHEKLESTGLSFHIPKFQKCSVSEFYVEPDVSSLFTLAALGAVSGKVLLKNFPFESLQPDLRFLHLFEQLGIFCQRAEEGLIIQKTHHLNSCDLNIQGCPDLFPVLVALCAGSKGTFKIFGAPQLKYKESDRLNKMSELLKLCGVKHVLFADGLTLYCDGSRPSRQINFSPESDHRLFMAATVLKASGFPLKILNPESVNKSFPEFLRIAESYL